MKKFFNMNILPYATLLAGLVGLLLRTWLFSAGTDEEGLLILNHPADPLIYILTALTLAGLLLCCLNIHQRVPRNMPASGISVLGHMAAALGTLATAILEFFQHDSGIISFTAGLLAAFSLFFIALKQLHRDRRVMVEMLLVNLYLMVHLVCQYRSWSAEPQLQNYMFPLLGSVFLMLSCYHRTALEIQGGQIRWFVFFNQAALFFCLLSLNTPLWAFYGAMGLWTVADLFTLRQVRPRRKAVREE